MDYSSTYKLKKPVVIIRSFLVWALIIALVLSMSPLMPHITGRGKVHGKWEPDSVFEFGPTLGHPAIIANVGPRTVTAPGGAISFTSISDLVTKINANAADSDFKNSGTSFTVTSSAQITWPAGKRPRIYFEGAPGTCTITSTGDFIGVSAPTPISSDSESYFEVHGGTWIGFGTTGSAFSRGAFIRRGPCTIEDTEVHSSNKGFGGGGAISPDYAGHGLSGLLVTCRYNHWHHNWRNGASDGGYGDTGEGHQQNYLFEHNEIDHNNLDLAHPGGDAAGCKFLFQVGTYRSNYFHDNLTWGLWFDTANKHTHAFQVQVAGAIHIYDNVMEDNSRSGLFFERSGYGHIHNNRGTGNGNGGTIGGQPQTTSNGWQLLVRNSRNTETDYNDVDMATGNVRTLAVANQSDETSLNNETHHNRVWLRTSGALFGGYDDNTLETLFTEPTIDWHDNLSMVESEAASYWQWAPGEGVVGWATWQAIDTDGQRQLI